ncbi:hypothetical protein [uncultured Thiodictyon sp.]|uniref:hypothetical protein n=1 Tax=uncultured Thiodictyon sp. TaxID=1846217 RepID=UPI0025DD6EEA|nr:hypothetical protein [uncultured Thiodictyon sp.]
MLQAIALQLIYRALSMWIGSDNWHSVIDAVKYIATDKVLTGEQKRQWVVSHAETYALALSGALLNLAIEAAYQWLKSKAPASQ